MTNNNLSSIISEVNLRAKTHPIGMLQEIRKELKGKKRLPARTIFTPLTTFDKYAFHHGGRKELQFNIGIEDLDGISKLRYGVAFSLETSQSLPNIDVFIPKIKLFNDFIQLYSEKYADMRMWHDTRMGHSSDYMPTFIAPELVMKNAFIFLGKRQLLIQPDYELLLNDLDRLLPLYKYIESNGRLQPTLTVVPNLFEFHPRRVEKKDYTQASQIERKLDIDLRHNVLQADLHRQLAKIYGTENVGDEQQSGIGTSIDVVVRQESEYWFYEIKTAQSPRACLRQAIGQLLEYAFWPGSQEATRLVVVGETALDEAGAEYLRKLMDRFSLPIEYEQITPST